MVSAHAAGYIPVVSGTAHRWLAAALVIMAGGLAANSLIGPLAFDLIDYPFSETVRNQGIGLEFVSISLVAPWSLVAAVLIWGSRTPYAPVLAVAPGGYTAYMMAQYIVGPNYVVYPHALLVHLALFLLGGGTALAGWSLCSPSAFARPKLLSRYGYLAAGLALFVVSRYLPAFAGSVTEEPLPGEFADDPAMFWTIVLLDIGVVVPAAVVTAVALFQRRPGAAKALYALTGWFTLVPVSVAAMAIVMLINDDPHKSTASAVIFAVAATLVTLFAAWVHVRLAGHQSSPGGG